jgi:hypothetical protein
MQDSPVFCHLLVDTQSKTERTTEAILKQNGWKFIQDGRYTLASPLAISNGSKTKLTFSLTQLAYQDGRLLDLAYNQSSNKFMPTQVGATYLANIRFKAKSSSQNNIVDVSLESPNVSFNPIVAESITFNKSANTEHFISITQPIFITQDVVTNGLEIYLLPTGGNISVYDYSVFVQKTFIP